MSKLLIALVAGAFAVTAFAQTPAPAKPAAPMATPAPMAAPAPAPMAAPAKADAMKPVTAVPAKADSMKPAVDAPKTTVKKSTKKKHRKPVTTAMPMDQKPVK